MNKRTVLGGIAVVVLLAAGWFLYFRLGPRPPLVGEWELRFLDDLAQAQPRPGESPIYTLSLRNDGTYSSHMENHIMMDAVLDSKGTYRVDGQKLILTGTTTGYMDDGYGKHTDTRPENRTLRIESDRLVFEEEALNRTSREPEAAFFRVGSPPARLPEQPKPTASTEARQLIQDTEKRYAAMDSYADEGTLKSSGRGFMAKEGRFVTRFKRGAGFLFRFDSLSEGKPYQTDAVWSDGTKSQVYMGMDGATGERPLGNGLSLIEVTCRDAALIPPLLMPDQFRAGRLSDRFSGVNLEADASLGGIACRVVALSNERSAQLKLWISKKSGLIVQAQDPESAETVTFKPRPGVKLKSKDLAFAPPTR